MSLLQSCLHSFQKFLMLFPGTLGHREMVAELCFISRPGTLHARSRQRWHSHGNRTGCGLEVPSFVSPRFHCCGARPHGALLFYPALAMVWPHTLSERMASKEKTKGAEPHRTAGYNSKPRLHLSKKKNVLLTLSKVPKYHHQALQEQRFEFFYVCKSKRHRSFTQTRVALTFPTMV